jgi:hypothetical protein
MNNDILNIVKELSIVSIDTYLNRKTKIYQPDFTFARVYKQFVFCLKDENISIGLLADRITKEVLYCQIGFDGLRGSRDIAIQATKKKLIEFMAPVVKEQPKELLCPRHLILLELLDFDEPYCLICKKYCLTNFVLNKWYKFYKAGKIVSSRFVGGSKRFELNNE